jgi:hypothetical protein
MSPHRSALVLPSLLVAALVVGACTSRAEREERVARRADREAVRAAAAQAAALATSDSMRGADAHPEMDHTDHTDSAPARTDSRRNRANLAVGSPGALVRGGDPPLRAGDVRVVSTNGALVLALIGDTVRVRLGDTLVTKLRHDLVTEADTVTGFGGFVARTVKGAVGGAMAEVTRFAVRVPVAEVRDLRYEHGELHFGNDRSTRDGNKTSAPFARDDAERFIRAVRARQRALGVPVTGG